MTITTQPAQWQTNYDLGWIGFCYTADAVGQGITYFEHWEDMAQVKVDHTLVVTGEDECIQAHIQNGVQFGKLSDYFNDPKTQIFFRKPVQWDVETGQAIDAGAYAQIGSAYGTPEIFALALADTEFGHLLNEWLKDKPAHLIGRMLDNPHSFICSKLVATALNSVPKYTGKGCLVNPAFMIDPQLLFQDAVLFEPWANQL